MSIAQLKQEIEKRWILTLFDESRGVIKFCNKIKLNSWGVGTILKVDATSKQIEAISYPMMETYTYRGSRVAKEANETIETMIYNL